MNAPVLDVPPQPRPTLTPRASGRPPSAGSSRCAAAERAGVGSTRRSSGAGSAATRPASSRSAARAPCSASSSPTAHRSPGSRSSRPTWWRWSSSTSSRDCASRHVSPASTHTRSRSACASRRRSRLSPGELPHSHLPSRPGTVGVARTCVSKALWNPPTRRSDSSLTSPSGSHGYQPGVAADRMRAGAHPPGVGGGQQSVARRRLRVRSTLGCHRTPRRRRPSALRPRPLRAVGRREGRP